ncbi:MAG: glycosyltransferase family 4 protein [Anaerolineae bacterium]
MVGPFGLRPKGTMAVRALPLAQALTRRGHTVGLFVPPWSYPADAGRMWDEDGVRIDNTAISPRTLITPRLVQRVRGWSPDVIHFFKPKAYSGLAAWLLWYLRRAGIGRARLVLDTDDWEGAGGWNDLENYSALQKVFFAWQEQWGLRHCDALTVASRALETIAWSLGIPRARVHYLPYGLTPFATRAGDARATVRAELGLSDAPLALLYTRFFEFRVERLVEIFARIRQLAPGAHLLVVGKGLFGEEEKLRALAESRALAAHITNVGWVEADRLPGYFAAADVAIYPFDDTLVNRTKCIVKLGDLLAAGVPVVAEAVGQNQEYIAHNESGILTSPGGVEEFACAAARLLQDAERRARLGRNAAARMARDYNWDRLCQVAETAYGQSLNTEG